MSRRRVAVDESRTAARVATDALDVQVTALALYRAKVRHAAAEGHPAP
jgi:hypothetical protein